MSSYNKQPESVLSRSNPTWYFFFDHHFLHKMHGLDNMIHMYIIVYQFQFLHVSITGPVSPLSSPPLCKHARCEIPWAQHAWHPGDFWNLRSNLDAINVISAMFKTRCWWLILLAFRSSDQQTSILQSDGSWTLLIWIVYVNRCLAHWVVNNG